MSSSTKQSMINCGQAINAMINLLLMCAEEVYIDDGEDTVDEFMLSLNIGDYSVDEVYLLDLFDLNYVHMCTVMQYVTYIFRNFNLSSRA